MAEFVNKTLRRWREARTRKSRWNEHWEDLSRLMLPRRAGFASASAGEGDRRTEDIYDGTPIMAARGLANAVGEFLWPEGRKSFSLRAEDDEIDNIGEVQDWLADTERRLVDAMENPRARFRQARGETNTDLVVLGTAVMFIGVGQRGDHLLYQSLHLKDAVPFFDEEGWPEGMFRTRKFTLRQAMTRFGLAKLSDASRDKIRADKLDDKIDILHAVVPRDEGNPDALLARNLPWTDSWIEIEAAHELSAGGYHEFPFIVPRWDTSSGEDFGRSPGMIALPDSASLQAMQETLLVAGQRSADPPIAAPNDGTFDAPNTFPGGLFFYDVETAASVRGNPFFPLETGSNMPITLEMQSAMREQVFAAFFRNVLNLPIDRPQMTATEIIERKEEFIREMGAVFGRLETDYTAPLVERSLSILMRLGELAPVPEAIAGKNIRIEYESPVKRIREMAEAAAARQWALETAQLGEIKPGALDLINEDGLARFGHEAMDLPKMVINDRDQVAGIRQARSEALEAAQRAAEIQSAVETADVAAAAAQKAGLTQQAA